MDVSFPEQWLVVALTRSVVHANSELIWKRHIWAFYREKLKSHVDREVAKKDPDVLTSPSFGDSLAKDTATAIFYLNQKSFWNLTAEMLHSGDNEVFASNAARVMHHFDPDAIPLNPSKVYDIKEILGLMDSISR